MCIPDESSLTNVLPWDLLAHLVPPLVHHGWNTGSKTCRITHQRKTSDPHCIARGRRLRGIVREPSVRSDAGPVCLGCHRACRLCSFRAAQQPRLTRSDRSARTRQRHAVTAGSAEPFAAAFVRRIGDGLLFLVTLVLRDGRRPHPVRTGSPFGNSGGFWQGHPRGERGRSAARFQLREISCVFIPRGLEAVAVRLARPFPDERAEGETLSPSALLAIRCCSRGRSPRWALR